MKRILLLEDDKALNRGISLKLEKDIEAIEQCAVAADPEIYQYIIKSVTEGVKYEFLKVPASRKKFYRARRKFFYLLDQKKG